MNMHEFQHQFQSQKSSDSILNQLLGLKAANLEEARDAVRTSGMGWIAWDSEPQPTDPSEPNPLGKIG